MLVTETFEYQLHARILQYLPAKKTFRKYVFKGSVPSDSKEVKHSSVFSAAAEDFHSLPGMSAATLHLGVE